MTLVTQSYWRIRNWFAAKIYIPVIIKLKGRILSYSYSTFLLFSLTGYKIKHIMQMCLQWEKLIPHWVFHGGQSSVHSDHLQTISCRYTFLICFVLFFFFWQFWLPGIRYACTWVRSYSPFRLREGLGVGWACWNTVSLKFDFSARLVVYVAGQKLYFLVRFWLKNTFYTNHW